MQALVQAYLQYLKSRQAMGKAIEEALAGKKYLPDSMRATPSKTPRLSSGISTMRTVYATTLHESNGNAISARTTTQS